MEWQAWLALGLTLGALLLMALTRIGPHLVLMAALTVLSVSGVLSPAEALAGFANSGLITVAAMFIVAQGLYVSGGIDWVVDRFLGRPKTLRMALLRLFLPVVPLSAFLNNTPVVATMIPAVKAWSRRTNLPASRLMIPLSYAAILGGTLTLIGTSTNLIVNGQYQSLTGAQGFSLFSITVVGLPVAIVGLLFIWLVFPRLLPDRDARQLVAELREFTLEVAVDPRGPLVGKSITEAGLRHLQKIYLVEIDRENQIITPVRGEERLAAGDRLVFAGQTASIADLLRINGLIPSSHDAVDTLTETSTERRLVEVVVSASCSAIGETIRDARFRSRYGAVVLAVARNGQRVTGNLGSTTLLPGDTLLLEARPGFIERQQYSRDFLLVSDLDIVQPNHHRAPLAWTILLSVIGLVTFDVLSMLNAALIAAALMIISRCLTAAQAEKALDLPVLVTIAASFALGNALAKTGVASTLAEKIVGIAGDDPLLLLIAVYLSVSMLTEIVTNNAAAVIMVPLVLSLCEQTGIAAEPFMLAIMMAASASFATPLGYQTNLMVYGPGGYQFRDFLLAGLPMNLLMAVTTIATIQLLLF